MTTYKCTDCNYATCDKSNFLKHNLTQKHLSKVDENTKVLLNDTQMKPNDTIKKMQYQCIYCINEFSTASSLARHQKACGAKHNLENSYKTELDKYKFKVKEMAKSKKKDTELKKQMQNEITYLKSQIQISGSVIKTSVSALAYVAKNYNDAPRLTKMDNYAYITHDDENDEFDLLETIFDNYRDKLLEQYLGNIIVLAYKKNNPAEQSVWNSDTTRLTYLVKDIINKKTDWTVDKKGIKTTKYIIDPLLSYIRTLLSKYIDDNCLENFVTEPYMKFKKRTDNLQTVAEIITIISNETLAEQILKYIAPHFYLTKNDELVAV
jgi:hypothetical protein